MSPPRLSSAALLFLLALHLPSARAHPLGNTTVNRQAAIVVNADRVQLRYVLDFAEIPTLLARGEADSDGDGDTSASEWQAWVRQRAAIVAGRLHFALQGQRVDLRFKDARWQLALGDAGLEILRLTFDYDVPVASRTAGRIDYRDTFEPARLGWKEVIAAAGSGARLLSSDVPGTDRSASLTRFEGEAPQTLAATIAFEPLATPVATTRPRRMRSAPPVPGPK